MHLISIERNASFCFVIIDYNFYQVLHYFLIAVIVNLIIDTLVLLA